MNRRRGGAVWSHGIAFPAERLYDLIERGIWSDPDSERLWIGIGDTAPYQLWDYDPVSGGVLRLQDVDFSCSWCGEAQTIPLNQFTLTHTTKSASCTCVSCGRQFDADGLSAKYFKDDLSEFLKLHRPWLVVYNHCLTIGM